MKMIDQGIFSTFRTGRAPNMTAKDLMTGLQNKDKLLESNLNNVMNAFRGSEQFWNRKASDLSAMDEKFGPATFFLTLSCKEYEWAEMRYYLEELDPELKGMGLDLGYLCANNPVAVSIFFEHRFRKFMNDVILDKNGPLGEVLHYVWRLEYQARGSPHIHMKLWIKDAPIGKNSKNSKEEVVAFIDKYITCRLPDPVKEPELFKLVKANQVHKCNESCLKRVRGAKGARKCRYGFPQSVQAETTLNTIDESVKSHVKGNKIKKMYNLARSEKEININAYNVAILLMWQANIDIQYVGEESMILNRYLTTYVAKPDFSATADLWDTISNEFSGRTVTSNLKSFAFQAIKDREVGGNEAIDLILGHPLMKMSETVIYLNARQKKERTRKFLSPDQLKALEENSTQLYCDNLIDVYYPNRPKELKHLCLYEVASQYYYHKGKMEPKFNKKTKEQTVFPFKILNNNGLTSEDAYFQVRKECIVKTPVFTIGGDQTEKHFHQLLFLFKPFIDEETDLNNEDETYQEAFERWYESLGEAELETLNEYRSCRERMKKAKESDEKLREEAEAEAAAEAENGDADEDVDDEQEQNLDRAEFVTTVLDACTVEEKMKMLNSDQKRVFDKIVSGVEHRDRHENNECDCENIEPLKMFVTGVGGTGKSLLIQTLRDYIVHSAAKKKGDFVDHGYVVVLAPTGVAAFNVNGQTIHRCFKLPVQKGKTANPQCMSLNQTIVKEIRTLLKFAKLIIIDEISMVSNATLTMIHRRLDEVFGGALQGISFGKKIILVFGDLLQLKPVRAPYCFKPLTGDQLESVLGGISLGYKLWNEFEYDVLTKIERQKEGESGFAELLSRLRVGSLTADDIEKLKGRLIDIDGYSRNARIKSAVKYFHDNLKGKNALCVMPTNEQVKQFNDQMIKYCNIQMIDIQCEEPFIKSADGKKQKPRNTLTKRKVSETAGLETVLCVGVGTRVMLRRNIDVSKGLVNGAMGNITKINFVRKNKVSSIEVLFDGKSKSTSIERVAGEYEKMNRIFVTRKQFPLHVAYAITIHKCQGVSVDHIMVDLGNTVFEKGQAYVALSRCRSLNGLHIIELKTNKLLCDTEAWDEYQRLHDLNGLPAMPEPNTLDTKGSSSSVKHPPTKRSAKTDIGPQPKKKRTTGVKRKGEMENTSGSPAAKHGRIDGIDVPSSRQVKFLKFQNHKKLENHCFVNSAIQALLALDFQWNQYCQYTDVCKKMAEYNDQIASGGSQKIINCGSFFRHNVDPLSQSAPFNDGNQNDAHEFTLALFKYLPPQLRQLFRHEEIVITTCQVCKKQSEMRKSEESLLLHRNADYKTFSELITAKEIIYDRICDNTQCRNYNKKSICERRRTLSFPLELKYLLVSLHIIYIYYIYHIH